MSDNAIDNMLPISSTRPKKKKYVKFHKIEIIELAFAMGDNPSVSNGVPLTLEWVAQKRTVMAVDFFETYRPTRCATWKLLRLEESSRMSILLESGYTQLEIDAATKEATRIRRLRRVCCRRECYSSRDGDDETDEEPPKQETGELEYEEKNEELRQQQTNKHQPKEESSDLEDPQLFPHHSDDALLRRIMFEATSSYRRKCIVPTPPRPDPQRTSPMLLPTYF
jgi:hypothetical protein